MARLRRTFLEETAVTGAALSMFGLSDVGSAKGASQPAVPTARAKALMGIFGLRYPIFMGPYGGPGLASAVSNAGAMGSIILWASTPDAAHQAVTRLRSQTKQPFVVNYVLAFDPASLPKALEAGAPVVGFSWVLPAKTVVAAIRNASAKFGVQVGTTEGARAALDLGADYLVCQGGEAGGHVQSSTPLYELMPRVLDEAKQIPVLAAGGIANGQNIRTALLAGAAGAVLGTRFVATQESFAHLENKNAIIRSRAKDTALSVCFQDGWPGATHRTLRNGTLNHWEAAGCPPVGKRPGEGDSVATGPGGTKVVRYSIMPPQAGFEGAVTDLAMYAGQGVDDVKDLPTARDLIGRLWAECLAARRL
jgi:nitronate monooxygenase